MVVQPNGTIRKSLANRWIFLALEAQTASELKRADPGYWSALATEAQQVLDAEERLRAIWRREIDRRVLREYCRRNSKENEMSESAERAVLAGGCFWIMEQLLRDRDGVISTRVGWIGGENENPTEENNVGHAEAVEVTFDPERLSYRALLEYFFMVHRPDLGEDVVGIGYRSEIFHASEEQRVVAEETIRDVDASGHWPGKVVTRVSEAGRFWEDSPEEQDYLQRFPAGCPAPFPGRGGSGFLNHAK